MVGDILFVYVTCATLDEARTIGWTLVEERLAACVNLRAHETIYRWQGAIETGPEVALIAKTTRAAWPMLQARVRELHSYTVPCIVALPVTAGEPAYLEWGRPRPGPERIGAAGTSSPSNDVAVGQQFVAASRYVRRRLGCACNRTLRLRSG